MITSAKKYEKVFRKWAESDGLDPKTLILEKEILQVKKKEGGRFNSNTQQVKFKDGSVFPK